MEHECARNAERGVWNGAERNEEKFPRSCGSGFFFISVLVFARGRLILALVPDGASEPTEDSHCAEGNAFMGEIGGSAGTRFLSPSSTLGMFRAFPGSVPGALAVFALGF